MENSSNRKWHLYIIPGSHFDLGWCASPAETFAYGDLIIKEAIDKINGELPDFRFTVEYAIFLKHFLDTYPHYSPIVKKLIDEGKFEVSALWTGMMDQIMGGECAIRNVTMAKKWAKEQFKIDLVTAQSSDCPGHTTQLAQILARCGVRYLAYSRYSAPNPLHKWRSPDGSTVISANHSVGLYKSLVDAKWAGSGYGWGFVFTKNIEEIENILPEQLKDIESLWQDGQPVLMGAESDLIPAVFDIFDNVELWNKRHQDIKASFSTITGFFNEVEPNDLPQYIGEAPYEFYTLGACFPKIYTKAKYAHNMLTTAEKMLSLQELFNLGLGNKSVLDESWERLTIPHDHNTGGRHGEINDIVRLHAVETAMVNANNVSEEAMLFIMTEIDHKNNLGIPIVIFNPLSWKRSIPIETYIETGDKEVENIAVFNSSGKSMPTQFLCSEGSGYKRVHFLFLAEEMPPVGYETFYVRFPKESSDKVSSIKVSENALENQYMKLSLDNGIIKSILWKPSNIELSKGSGFFDLLVRENIESDIWDNHTGKTWQENKVERKVEILESGALRGKLRIISEILGCKVIKELSLYDALPNLDLSVTIDWLGERNCELLAEMPFNVPNGAITYETTYGHAQIDKDEMPGTYKGKGGRYVQKWIDVSNEEMGVTLATDCISHVLDGTNVNPMLIRTAYSCGTPHHWYNNIGEHSFRFSLMPHSDNWDNSLAFRLGWEHSTPTPVGRMNICAPIAPFRNRTFLPQNFSLCNAISENILLTTIKKADDDLGYIIRLVEICGEASHTSLSFGFNLKGAWKTDLLENNLYELAFNKNELSFHILPYEIYTIRIIQDKNI